MNATTLSMEDEVLRFAGELVRAEVRALWSRLPADLARVRRIDLSAVERLDSAGIALLSVVLERCGDPLPQIDGVAPDLDALRQAYRLDPHLGFASHAHA